WQAGNWVAGLEGDIQMSGQGATPSYVCPAAICNPTVVDFDAPVTAKFVQGQKLDSFGTLRGRLGTTIMPDVIAYATGGLGVGSIRPAITLSGVGFDADGNPFTFDAPFSVLKIMPGWTVGAGLEARLFGNVTGKVEYLYMDFGTVSASVTNAVNTTPITFSTSSHVTDNIVRAGVNYKFDPVGGGYDVPPGIAVPLIFKAPPYGAPVAIAWSWAGPYVGINAGYSTGKSKTDAVFSDPTGAPLFTTGSADNLNGMIAGFQGGYNWMVSSWLMAGIEADIQLSTQNTTPTLHLSRRHLQSGHRRPRYELRPHADIGLVRHGARPPRRDRHAGDHGVSHRRACCCRDQDCRHRCGVQPLRRRRQSQHYSCRLRLLRPQDKS